MFPPVVLIVYLGGVYFASLMVLTLFISMYEWIRLSKKTHYYLLFSLIGIIYLGGAHYLFYQLREIPEIGWIFSILAYFCVWSSDSFAYIFGKKIGGAKLAPKISPNKTRAGLLGAVFGAVIVLVIGDIVMTLLGIDQPNMGVVFIVIFGALIGLFAQIGDLLVSALKRKANQKDSGHIIPGHGGLLDRIDALLLAAPIFYVGVELFLIG